MQRYIPEELGPHVKHTSRFRSLCSHRSVIITAVCSPSCRKYHLGTHNLKVLRLRQVLTTDLQTTEWLEVHM